MNGIYSHIVTLKEWKQNVTKDSVVFILAIKILSSDMKISLKQKKSI